MDPFPDLPTLESSTMSGHSASTAATPDIMAFLESSYFDEAYMDTSHELSELPDLRISLSRVLDES